MLRLLYIVWRQINEKKSIIYVQKREKGNYGKQKKRFT